MITLPIQKNTTTFIADLVLESKIYKFKYTYNVRDQAWSLSIFNQAGTSLLEGIKLVTNWEFLRPFKSELLPPGALFAVDTVNNPAPIAKDDLGERIKMVYLTLAEVEDMTTPPAASAAPLTAAPP